jgi:citrate lyase subunit beta/citryl-CoA lyase
MTLPPARSELAVPGSNPRMIEKAVASAADAVFLDLEDAVAPERKIESRSHVLHALRELAWGAKPRAYRINSLDTQFWYRDVIDVVETAGACVDLIVVPKVNRADDLHAVDLLLSGIERGLGLAPGKIALEAQIETAAGLVEAERIAAAVPRLARLTFGPGDFAASVRMPAASIGGFDRWDEAYPGHRLHYAMTRIAVAARAAGVQIMDGPVADYRDPEVLLRACSIARGLGFDGKWCIHPAQIEIVNEAFTPSDEDVDWARRVLAAYAEAGEAGIGAISLDGRLIDAASIRLAQSTVALVSREP